MMPLLDLLQPPAAPGGARIAGVVTAVVTNNQDPESLGRVKVRFPWLAADQESPWARVATPMAGAGGGMVVLPPVDAEVLVAFDQGDPRFPYVVGALWNQGAPPPADGSVALSVVVGAAGGAITLTCDGDLTLESTGGALLLRGSKGVELKSADGDVVVEGKQITLN